MIRKGQGASIQDTAEQQTTMVMATQAGVDVAFSSVDMTLSIDDYAERILAPQINTVAGQVALDIMGSLDGVTSSGIPTGGACNFVSNVDGSGNIISPTAKTFTYAGAVLDANSAERTRGKRKIVIDPFTQANAVTTFSGLFNDAKAISDQYNDGTMKHALGFDWLMDQTVIKHTSGTFTAGTVFGAGQTGTPTGNAGQTLVVNAITGTLKKGDIITIAGVNSINKITKQDAGRLRQFVVLADAASGATSISIYPSIIPPVGGSPVQYQTVTASPANSATILLVSKPSEVYVKNFAYVPEAITLATADMELANSDSVKQSRAVYDGVSIRMSQQYDIRADQNIQRLDVLYGWLVVRPEWVCVVADSVS